MNHKSRGAGPREQVRERRAQVSERVRERRAQVSERVRERRGTRRARVERQALIDRFLPVADIVEVRTIVVDAPPEATYEALRDVNFAELRSPLLRGLMAISMRAVRRARRRRGLSPLPSPLKLTLENMRQLGRVILADRPGFAIVIGAIARPFDVESMLERRTAEEFTEFECPGHVKAVAGFRMRRHGERQTLLTYESRTRATDTRTRRALFLLDRFTAPLTRLAMQRVLELVKINAERACSEQKGRRG